MITGLVLVIVGLLLAFAGRRLVWLLVGAVGFLVGYALVSRFMPQADSLIGLVVGLAVGVLFAFLARAFAKFLLAVAGFILIGGLALTVAGYFGIHGGVAGVLAFIIGGVLGIVLVSFAFDLSILLLSVVAGAALIIQGLDSIVGTGHESLVMLVGLVLAVLGLLAQFASWRRR